MSIVSQICADISNEIKEKWTKELEEIIILYKFLDEDFDSSLLENFLKKLKSFQFGE